MTVLGGGVSASATKETKYMRGSPTEISGLALLLPAVFQVRFADGYCATRNVSVFEMPVDRLRWETLSVVPGGKAITVTDTAGEPLEIDAKTVRFYTDSNYAKQVKAEHARNRLTRDELTQLASNSSHRPDPQPEGDFYRAAWK